MCRTTPRPVRTGKSDGARWLPGAPSGARGGQIATPVQDEAQFVDQIQVSAANVVDRTRR